MAIALAVIAGMVSLSFLIYGYRDLTGANDWAKLLQAVLTLTAFTLAAYWYFAERKGMPHADVSQEIHVTPVSPGTVSVEVHVRIKNLGQRLLRVTRIYTRLQAVEAESYRYDVLSQLDDDRYWSARRPGSTDPQFKAAELRWPVIRQFNDEVQHDIEPGESDLFVATFLARCSDLSRFRVATDIYKPGEDPDNPLAWKARSFGTLAEACDSGGGEGE